MTIYGSGLIRVGDTNMYRSCGPSHSLPMLVDSDGTADSVSATALAGATVGVTGNVVNPGAETWTYSLVSDTSGGGFQIDPNSGVVTVLDPAKLISLAPVLVDGDAAANSVSETDTAGATVGVTGQVNNPAGETWTYSIVSDSSNGGFQIDPNTGVVTVLDGSKIVAQGVPTNITPPQVVAAVVGTPVVATNGTWT